METRSITPRQAAVREAIRRELKRRKFPDRILAPVIGLSAAGVSRRMSGETAFDERELEAIEDFLDIPITEVRHPRAVPA